MADGTAGWRLLASAPLPTQIAENNFKFIHSSTPHKAGLCVISSYLIRTGSRSLRPSMQTTNHDDGHANNANSDADRPRIYSGNETNDSRKETNESGKETPNEEPLGKAGAGGLFAWVGPALRNPRLLKTWIRCVLNLTASIVLLVDNATLKTMGQTGFFAATRAKIIVSVLLLPSLALFVFVLASVTLLLGTFGVGVLRARMPKLALLRILLPLWKWVTMAAVQTPNKPRGALWRSIRCPLLTFSDVSGILEVVEPHVSVSASSMTFAILHWEPPRSARPNASYGR
ncbi:hypothetical protein B0H13DRAFT_2493137 [Mycena leptocephala]|nr:hypothetical protein B0H13DRAFT_2493137 [Mycena leptocephala]